MTQKSKWISLNDRLPQENKIYWCYPTSGIDGIYALQWDGDCFSSGSYMPLAITHYCEIEFNRPEPPIGT